jgi:hypothetical protein
MPNFIRATNADIKPGAVFVLRDTCGEFYPTLPLGTRMVVVRGDRRVPLMARADGGPVGGGYKTTCYMGIGQFEVERAASQPADTIAIPRDVAVAWFASLTDTSSSVGTRDTRIALRDAIRLALIEADPAVADARALLVSKGFVVSLPNA